MFSDAPTSGGAEAPPPLSSGQGAKPSASSLDLLESRRDLPALDELRAIPQWVAWRLKDVVTADGTVKQTKPPVNPKRGGGASHSDSDTWGSFDQARIFARTRRLAGIGFVLSDGDGFTGIDLDKCRDPVSGAVDPWAQDILDLRETYAEISPSGTGIRMIVRGKIDAAVKYDPAHVEMYGRQRYLTITANHLPDMPDAIHPAPRTIEALRARVEVMKAEAEAARAAAEATMQASTQGPGPSPRPPEPKLNFLGGRDPNASRPARPGPAQKPKGDGFFRAVNNAALARIGAWASALFPQAKPQPGTGAYRITSRALGRNLQEDISIAPDGIVDFGVHDMGDARQGKRTAVDLVMEHGGAPDPVAAARWLCDVMGLSPESLGWREQEEDEPGPEVVMAADGTLYDAATGEVLHEPGRAPADLELPERLTRPAGLLGEIVNWITDSARQPNRVLSLGAAITVLGTVIGRRVAGPTGAGVHLYVAMLAPSAGGKDHPLKRAADLVRGVQADLAAPTGFTSQTAICRHVAEHPLSLSASDELGNVLRRLTNPRAGNWEIGVTKVLREIWGASFETITGEQRAAGRDPDTRWPAFSWLGASNPNEFFDALGSAEVSNGFLNRFLLLATSSKAPKVEPVADRHAIPDAIHFAMARLFASCRGDLDADSTEFVGTTGILIYAGDPDIRDAHGKINIAWEENGIRDAWLALDDEASDRMEADGNELWGRTAEMAVRLATIHAVGRAGLTARVMADDWAWGRDLARWSAETMSRQARLRISDTAAQANAKLILRHISEAGGSITHRNLGRKLQHRLLPVELKNAIASLVDSGDIQTAKTTPPKGGTVTVTYILCGD